MNSKKAIDRVPFCSNCGVEDEQGAFCGSCGQRKASLHVPQEGLLVSQPAALSVPEVMPDPPAPVADVVEFYRGESVLLTKAANMFIELTDGTRWLLLLGQKREALGGRLYLTNYRLIFQSHSFNSVMCRASIPLDAIVGLRDRSKLIMKKLSVDLRSGTVDFVVWDVPGVIKMTQEAIARLDEVRIQDFNVQVSENPSALGTLLTRLPLAP